MDGQTPKASTLRDALRAIRDAKAEVVGEVLRRYRNAKLQGSRAAGLQRELEALQREYKAGGDGPHDMERFGLLLAFDTPGGGSNPDKERFRLQFDTGALLFLPGAIVEPMVFHLRENDPKPPEEEA